MISLIICSRTSKISNNLWKNINDTIGCEYELIVIDNSKNEHSIFSAYNEGVKRSQGDILCFMHDDIEYKTKDWGKEIHKKFLSQDIGCVGVIGSYIITDFGYWDMMHPYVTGKVDNNDCNMFFQTPDEVSVVDGMWFCIPKQLFNDIRFDDKQYTNFHWYDMDICMQILQQKKRVCIERNIQISHCCHPRYDRNFMDNMTVFQQKWANYLPIYRGVTPDEMTILAMKRNIGLFYEEKRQKLNCENCTSMKLGQLLLKPLHFIRK